MTEAWETVVDDLRGTCKSLEQSLEQLGLQHLQDDKEFHEYLDGEIFLCHVCGWWCEIYEECSEEHGLDELTCEDCT